MKQWQQLPAELQLDDEAIKALSIQATEAIFAKAKEYGILEDFSKLFWEAIGRINATKPSLQECVYLLEEQKRSVGRRYDNVRVKPGAALYTYFLRKSILATKYNELEYQIQWLVRQYGLKRTSREYFLEVNTND